MNLAANASRRVRLLAPVGRDAELGCATLAKAGIDCLAGRSIADLDATTFDDLDAMIMTEEVLTAQAVEALRHRLDAQACWSQLTLILLVDRESIKAAETVGGSFGALVARSGTILLQRPTREETLVSVVRAAVAGRRRQFELGRELEAREAAEARARTLAQEMQHRVKNAFALALSIARQSFRGAASLDEAREAFTGRLNAMAETQDLIMSGGDEAVDIFDLLDRTLAPYRPAQGAERVILDGPKVLIPKDKATPLVMAFHELATNAAKYGALSTATGRVSVHWRLKPASDANELTVEWQERGGPPVSPPTRRGFGSLLVEQSLTSDLGGSTELTFDPAGVVCKISARIPTTGD